MPYYDLCTSHDKEAIELQFQPSICTQICLEFMQFRCVESMELSFVVIFDDLLEGYSEYLRLFMNYMWEILLSPSLNYGFL